MDIDMIGDPIVPLNRLRCASDTDLMGEPFGENNVVVFLTDDRSDNYICYTREELNRIITAESQKDIFISKDNVILQTEPLFKEPYTGIMIDNSMIAFQHERAFFIYKLGKYYTSKGPKVRVYSLFPISLETVLTSDIVELKQRIKRSIPGMKESLYRTKMSILAGGAIPQFIGENYVVNVMNEDELINRTLIERGLRTVNERYLPEKEERIVQEDGAIVWMRNGIKHRGRGLPAVIHEGVNKEWWVNGKRHRGNDLPAIEWEHGGREWWVDGLLHREEDLPALVEDGQREWWVRGRQHRDNDLPAIESVDGNEWWVNGRFIRRSRPPIV